MMPENNNFWNANTEQVQEITEQVQENPQTQYNINQEVMNEIHGQPTTIPMNQGYSANYYPETSAVLAIILAVLSIAMCGLFTSIPAIIVARKALDITDNIPNHPDAGTAKAAFVIGWISTVIQILGLIFFIIFMIVYTFYDM